MIAYSFVIPWGVLLLGLLATIGVAAIGVGVWWLFVQKGKDGRSGK
jgi:hypothetical protein